MCTGSGRGWVADFEVGWCPVRLRNAYRIVPAPQHPLLSLKQRRLIVGDVVPIPAQEPDKSTPMTWVEALMCRIVVHQGHGVGELVTRLALGPVDGLQDISVEDVVRGRPLRVLTQRMSSVRSEVVTASPLTGSSDPSVAGARLNRFGPGVG